MSARFFFSWAVTLSLGACTQPVKPISPSGAHMAPPVIFLPEAFPVAQQKVLDYVRSRGRFASIYTPSTPSGLEVRINETWARDQSLRYYRLEFDTRIRHIVAWKGQWILKSVDAATTQVQLPVLEVLYLGPAEEAGHEPKVDDQWFETERDGLRSALELRRFWNENYPDRGLPAVLSNLSLPDLAGPPRGRLDGFPAWRPSQRPRTF